MSPSTGPVRPVMIGSGYIADRHAELVATKLAPALAGVGIPTPAP